VCASIFFSKDCVKYNFM